MPVTIDVAAKNSINPDQIHSIRAHCIELDLHGAIPLDTGACSNDILAECRRQRMATIVVALQGSRSSI